MSAHIPPDGTTTGPARTWLQMLALVVGGAYLVVGIAGFFATGVDDFFAHDTGEYLLGFEINGMHNVVHIVVGLAGLVLARTLAAARLFGWLLAVGYGATFVYGLFAIDEEWDFLSLNWADNWLHLGSALVGLAMALGPVRSVARERLT